MGLKTIFQMTKTDRYTQDGRDKLAELQETEDVKYKTGDISQKTGLQKQPDGSWAPPKGGAHPKMGSKEYNEKYGLSEKDVKTGAEIDKIYEKHQKRIKELKAKGYTDEQIENDKIYQQTKEDMKNVGKSKPAAGNNLKWNEMPSGRVWTSKTPGGKPLTVTWNREKNGDVWYGRSDSEAKYKSKEEAMNAPVDYQKEIAEHREAAQYYKRKARSFSETDPSYSTYMKKAEEYENKAKELEGNKPAEKPTDKYKDLPGAQRKDALFASTFEGISIGQTQNQMERQGWELISTGEETGENVNVYGKPDGSKVTMKHDGKTITSTEYEAPGSADAAPKIRELTGDCKIKIRQTQDVKYKTGDISQKTGLQKQPDGSWAPPKKGGKPAGKNGPSRMEKEEAIRKDLGLRGENDLERFSDEQIEMMYQKSQRTPEQQKADFDNSKIGQAVNKGRQEYAAEKARQKELASKTNAIGLPKENKPAAAPVEKFDIEEWKTGPKVKNNAKLDWSHGVVGESIPVQGKSAEEKRNLINKYNSVGRLSRIGTKKNSYYNNKYGTFEVAGMDNDNVYIQEERRNGLGSTYTVLVTIPLNEVEEINPFHDYGKRNPETGEESPTRPPLPEDSAPRILTGDTKIRIKK